MSAEAWSALFAAVAVAVSIVSIVYALHTDSQRRVWEMDQDTKRNSWAKDLQDRQNSWQEARDEAQRHWEASLRHPELKVVVEYSFSPQPVGSVSDTRITTTVKNTGMVPVFFSNWGGFQLPDEHNMTSPIGGTSIKYGENDDFGEVLTPGNSISSWWNKDHLVKQLAKNGYLGAVVVRGQVRDRLGNTYQSTPFNLHVPDQPDQ